MKISEMKHKILFIGLLPIILFLVVIFFGKDNHIEGMYKQVEVANENKIAESARIVRMLFAGDLMLDRYNRTIIKRNGIEYFTNSFNDLLSHQDLNIVNLEGPVTNNQSVSVGTKEAERSNYIFTFDKKDTQDFFRHNRINVVNLGNNHILNFGEAGLKETTNFLDENNVGYFGSPADEENIYIEKNINGLKIGLVSYNAFHGLKWKDVGIKISEIRSKNDFIIVYAHWGKEYELNPTENQKMIAYSFVDSGADVVIGSHPHVVQPIEIYKNKAIFYSLGNFVFDQYFSEDVREELLVKVALQKGTMEFSLIPLYNKGGGGLVMDDKDKSQKLLERLAIDSIASETIKNQIRAGKFSIDGKIKEEYSDLVSIF